MTFHIITIFPNLFESYLSDSIMKRAIIRKDISVKFYNPRDFTKSKHNKVDDIPYGGGPGMVMMADPIIAAWKKARGVKRRAVAQVKGEKKNYKTVILSPGGKEFTTAYAKQSAKKYTDIIIICGRYEGIDARVKKFLGRQADEVSIGNYVLTGGELAAMVMIDSISRQIPGVLGNASSLEESRVSSHEVYTRPEVLEETGKKYRVPPVLLSGNHKLIDEWRKDR
ncbi:tRNA (guanosine(37)-N1)-methyltransferase TrmD [Patescibacteria group bacterium]|nr:tRNA (guanosine(37)-N1)-methyltransferase TrmD [Patescibacteria group bacterium]